MNKYTFLVKPALFIFNLIFVTWLVFSIEKIKPSDFGSYGEFFEDTRPLPIKVNKQELKKLFYEHRTGKLDSLMLERKIEDLFVVPGAPSK